jgi:hypothetical protein
MFRKRVLGLLAVLVSALALPGSAVAGAIPSTTLYYFGDVKHFAPDGAKVLWKTTSLVKRVLDPSQNTIMETVTQPPRAPNSPAVEFTMIGTRVGNTNTFSVTAPDHSYSGAMTYSGPDWKWSHWSYDLTMKTGEKIAGGGSVTGEGVKITKLWLGPGGELTRLIQEDLKPISEAKYTRLKAEFDSLPKSFPKKNHYYYGHIRITRIPKGVLTQQEVLLLKTMDPANQSFAEIACRKNHQTDPALEPVATIEPVYMKVSGLRFEIYDRPDFRSDKLSGSGTLEGTPWNWEHLTFSMLYSDGPLRAKIEDANFVTEDQLIARKQLFLADGTPFQVWDGELKSISEKQFDEKLESMKCPKIERSSPLSGAGSITH